MLVVRTRHITSDCESTRETDRTKTSVADDVAEDHVCKNLGIDNSQTKATAYEQGLPTREARRSGELLEFASSTLPPRSPPHSAPNVLAVSLASKGIHILEGGLWHTHTHTQSHAVTRSHAHAHAHSHFLPVVDEWKAVHNQAALMISIAAELAWPAICFPQQARVF